ncbi:MAG TPA: glycosyltransferase family 39 protein, partial [Bryobacteraceae bacterium]|nr:glycosyltransferase family 39 protein [Bryobacteraceae bacterium]
MRTSGSAAFSVATASLVALSALTLWAVHLCGWTLYSGDAEAHLMIARTITDSQTPGYGQFGTVWLPLPHILMLPLACIDSLWRNGLAGAIPAALCFVLAGAFLFAAVERLFASTAAAAAAMAAFAVNPNLLYLQSIPMNETIFFAALAGLLYFGVRFAEDRSWKAAVGAGVCAWAATLTRYDGWFLLPVAAIYFLWMGRRGRIPAALLFCVIAASGPLLWMGYDWWMTGDALDFYRGPYSALAIQGRATYPGLHDWHTAFVYYSNAVKLCAGPLLVTIGFAGAVACLLRRKFWPVVLCAIPPLVYVASVHSGGLPIFLPTLWPHSYYNARYGTSAIPLFAIGIAALVALAPRKAQPAAALVLVAFTAGWWAFHARPSQWVVWEESRVNSEGRRAWTRTASDFLSLHYHSGDGLLTSSYPLT